MESSPDHEQLPEMVLDAARLRRGLRVCLEDWQGAGIRDLLPPESGVLPQPVSPPPTRQTKAPGTTPQAPGIATQAPEITPAQGLPEVPMHRAQPARAEVPEEVRAERTGSEQTAATSEQVASGKKLVSAGGEVPPRDEVVVSPQLPLTAGGTPATDGASAAQTREEALAELAQRVAQCTLCPELVRNRTQTVFGVGNPYTELVFIGEAPGAEEDAQGIPFVGRAGQLLTNMITNGMGMRREDVYICNILRCRPPNNRPPTHEEAARCRPWLDATLAIIQPKYICCLGSVAAQNLLATDVPIGRLRGRVLEYNQAKVVCTYHPAYLLRNPGMKRQTWEDLKLLLKLMGRPIPR